MTISSVIKVGLAISFVMLLSAPAIACELQADMRAQSVDTDSLDSYTTARIAHQINEE